MVPAPASLRVLFNADVRTMDTRGSVAQAVAWRDGRIVAIGTQVEVERATLGEPPESLERIDAHGATVLPGFVDAHHHPSVVALYGGQVRLLPPAVTDIPSLQRALAAAAAALPPGRWLVASSWDEALLAERRPPTRAELDDAVPDRPLMAMHYTCHRALANSRALELAGIRRDTPDPPGGTIGRGPRGVPDGLLVERGMSRVETLERESLAAHDLEGFLTRLAHHHREMAAVGITRVVDATVPGDVIALYREAARRGLLTVPTILFPVSTTGYLEAPWDALSGPVTGHEEGLLRIGPVKLVFDGAPGCALCLSWLQAAGTSVRSWAMAVQRGSLDPLRTLFSIKPRLGRDVRTGIHIYSREEARALLEAATARGFAVATHAIGNAAVELAVSVYEELGAPLGQAGIPRIEHGTFLDRELVARVAGVGAAVVTQPHFMSVPSYDTTASIPGLRNAPLRWLLDAGVKVAGSSDHPVAGFAPLDGVRAAVARRTSGGHAYEPDQRIELHEAIALYTRTAAEVCGCLDECGTLEIGKRADLVVLDRSLEANGALDSAAVRTTILGGVRFSRTATG